MDIDLCDWQDRDEPSTGGVWLDIERGSWQLEPSIVVEP
jgi:hypothetical protein